MPFYGRQPSPEDVAKIKCPLLIHYAELDERLNEGWPAYEAAMQAAVSFETYTYPGVNHGFHNDSMPRTDPLEFLTHKWLAGQRVSLRWWWYADAHRCWNIAGFLLFQ